MICHSRKAIFVHIQKTGGNAISRAFHQSTSAAEKHFTARELRAIYGESIWAECFKFAFVRNPWDRLVSWWSMIDALRPAHLAGRSLNKFQTFVLERASTFEEFLENCDEDIADTDGRKWIYRNQLEYLADDDGSLLVDFVGRFEHLQRDFNVVTRRVLVEPTTLAHVNKSQHQHYTRYYSRALADNVRHRYALDVKAFGYEFGH